jgi:hypothetical protein
MKLPRRRFMHLAAGAAALPAERINEHPGSESRPRPIFDPACFENPGSGAE